jgi:hypothetical protein
VRQVRLFALLCCWTGAAYAAEMRSVDVEYKDSRYTVQSEVWFNAPREQVYEVFSHWDLSTQFSSVIVKSNDLEPDEHGRPQFFVRNRGCVLFFCKTFERQGHVESQPFEVLRAFADPALSDFHISNESWTFTTEQGGTVVVYQLLMQPKFWVPPVIGPYLIKRKFNNSGGTAIDRIEEIARGMTVQPVWNFD